MILDFDYFRSEVLVLVISLGKLRSQTLQSFLDRSNYQIIPAVNKKSFKNGRVFVNRFPSFNNSNYLSSGEYACVQSHKKVLQRFLDSQKQFCLILEDDAELIFTPEIIQKMLLNQIFSIFDMNTLLHCGGMQGLKFEPYFWLRSRLVDTRLHKFETRPLYRTMSYVVTRKSAETYLQYLSNCPCPVADDWRHFVSSTDASIKFKNIFSHPRSDNESLISSERHGKT